MNRPYLLLAAACAAGYAVPAIAQQVPPELAELIPESAEDDPEGWAVEGADAMPAEPAPEASLPPPPEPLPPLTDDEIETIVDAGIDPTQIAIPEDIPVPQPLEPDPAVEALAEIDAPDLIELADLTETRISDELVLAFPVDESLFPEREEFVERFSALSNIETLEGDNVTIPQLAARARADQDLLDEALRTYGYYDAEVIQQLSGGRRIQPGSDSEIDADPRVRFDIIPGVQYVFGTIDLGAFDTIRDQNIREKLFLQSGQPLYADKIVEQRIVLSDAMLERGYPFAEVDEPSLLIDHARFEGDLTMIVTPGGRYRFADVTSNKPEFLSDKHLGRIARFEPGDLYERNLQNDLRSAVLATGLVSSVSVTPRIVTPAQGDQDGEVALDVAFEPAPLRTLAGAIGYGTEEGIRVEASWEHRNLFPPEGALKLRGVLGTREQFGSVSFRRNNFRARDQVLTFEVYAGSTTTEAVDARGIGARGSFEKVSTLLFQKPLSYVVGAEVLYSDERNRVINGVERPRQLYTVGSVFGRVTWDSSDNLLDPTKGARTTLFVAPEYSFSEGVGTFYLRTQADATYYQSVGSTVLAGRVRAAANFGTEPFRVAPSRRLYSGGGGSVRGYGFQAIGPLNDFGEPTGGGSLIEASVEARVETGLFDGGLEIVPFFDLGTVSLGTTPDFRFVKYGAGVGIRYNTTFGPIRVDVATPLNPGQFDSPVVVYVGLGQAF